MTGGRIPRRTVGRVGGKGREAGPREMELAVSHGAAAGGGAVPEQQESIRQLRGKSFAKYELG